MQTQSAETALSFVNLNLKPNDKVFKIKHAYLDNALKVSKTPSNGVDLKAGDSIEANGNHYIIIQPICLKNNDSGKYLASYL